MNRVLNVCRFGAVLVASLYVGTSVSAQSECGPKAYSPNAQYKSVSACNRVPENEEIRGNYGWQYECVEYVRRFYGKALHVPKTDDASKGPWLGNANTFLNEALDAKRGLVPFKNGGVTSPLPDDILVFYGGTVGHVAIVTNVTSDRIDFIEQNFSSKTAFGSLKLTVSAGPNNTYTVANRGVYTVAGWARLKSTAGVIFDAGANVFLSRPIVDSQGNVRVLAVNNGFKIYSITPTGSKTETIGFPADVRGRKEMLLAPGDRLYFNGASTTVQSFDVTGMVVPGWPVTLGSNIANASFFTPLIVNSLDGTLYAKVNGTNAPAQSSIFALNPDGSEKWHRDFAVDNSTGTTLIQGPNGDLYTFVYPSDGAHFARIDRLTGAIVCNQPGGGSNRAGGDAQDIFTDDGSALLSFGSDCKSRTIYNASSVLFSGYNNGIIFALESNVPRMIAVSVNGGFMWRNNDVVPTGDPTILVVKNNVLYIFGQHLTDGNKQKLFSLNVNTGQIINMFDAASLCQSCRIGVADSGAIYAIDTSQTKLIRIN